MNKEDFLTDLYSELIPTIRQKHNMSTEQALCACFENFNKLQEWDLSLFVLDEILELDPNNTIFSRLSREVFLEYRKKIVGLVEAANKVAEAKQKVEESKAEGLFLKQSLITIVVRNWMVQRNGPRRSVTDELKFGQRVLILPVIQANLDTQDDWSIQRHVHNLIDHESWNDDWQLQKKELSIWKGWSLPPPSRLAKVPPDTVVVDDVSEPDSELYKLLDDLEGEEEVPELFEGVYRGKPYNQGGFIGEGDYDIVEIESTMKDTPPMMRGIIMAVWLEPENQWDSVLEFFFTLDT